MRVLILTLLTAISLPLQAFDDNEEILQNSQALLEKARKMDEMRAKNVGPASMTPSEPVQVVAPPKAEETPIKNPDDVLKVMKREKASAN